MKSDSIVGAVFGVILRTIFAIAVIYVIYQGINISYDYGFRIFAEPAISSGEGRTFTVKIKEDMSPVEMGELFEAKGLIRDKKLFVLQYYCSEYRKDMKPGEYELSTAMTAEEMFGVMATPKQSDTPEEKE